MDVDLHRLKERIAHYFSPNLSHEEIARLYPSVMNATAPFNAREVRDMLLRRGGPQEACFVRHTYRPFDNRWLYWEVDTKLLDEKRLEYRPHVFDGNLWLSAVPRLRRDATESQSSLTSHSASLHLNEWSASMFPAWLHDDGLGVEAADDTPRRPNLSPAAHSYLDRLDLGVEDLFHHVLAVLHDPAYREANAGALRMEWPRISLPGWPASNGDGAAEELAKSAARGRELAALLDPDTPVPGVTEGGLRPEIAAVAVPSTTDGGNMSGDDFSLTAGWGHFGQGEAVMPGQGRAVERPYTASERAALTLGDTTFDAYLNDRAYWRNVPASVWSYKLGGYQVPKEVAFVPRAQGSGQANVAGGRATLHRHGAADCGDNWCRLKDGELNEQEKLKVAAAFEERAQERHPTKMAAGLVERTKSMY